MALRALVLGKKLQTKRSELEKLMEAKADLEKRSAELEASIEEAETEEDQKVVEEEAEKLETEIAENETARTSLEAEISDLENQLAEEERKQETPAPKAEPEAKRGEIKEMTVRAFNPIDRMSAQEREAFAAREDVKNFAAQVRSLISEKRAVTGANLTIPTVMLGMIRENIIEYSKLYKHAFVRPVRGDARQNILGAIPEAVWTECCAKLNEIDLAVYDASVYCNKVGAFVPVCNAIIEDSDLDLVSEILSAIGQSIGIALDKAILYGTGVKMPLGIVTRLAQTSEPADYPTTARPWVDLHTSNILTIASSVTGADLFKAFVLDSGAAKGKYSRGEKVWVMNEQTYTTLIANAMSINAAGAIVSGVNGVMPVVGGVIEVLSFIPDNVIIGGYFDLYLLAERRGVQLAQSEHYKFVEDQTVFKGTARYDGLPVIAEAFVAIGINSVTPNASMSFAPDEANSNP